MWKHRIYIRLLCVLQKLSRFIYIVNDAEKSFFFEKIPVPPLPSWMVWSIMTIFPITEPFLDGSLSSSNSTEILDEIMLCTKFHDNRISRSEVIV